MAKRSSGFNLSAVIREYRKGHSSVPASDALEAVKKAHPGQKINEGTFKATFYKLAGGGKRKKTVKRRQPDRLAASGGDQGEAVMKAGLNFVLLAGARMRRNGLPD